jgi:hypothetical protein
VYIFIDESGVFVPSPTRPGISLVGALVIPEGRIANVVRKYKVIRARLPKERGEVKGRLLAEAEVSEIVDLLRRNECLLLAPFKGSFILVKDHASANNVAAARALSDALAGTDIASPVQAWPGSWETFGGMLNGAPFSAARSEIRLIFGGKPN